PVALGLGDIAPCRAKPASPAVRRAVGLTSAGTRPWQLQVCAHQPSATNRRLAEVFGRGAVAAQGARPAQERWTASGPEPRARSRYRLPGRIRGAARRRAAVSPWRGSTGEPRNWASLSDDSGSVAVVMRLTGAATVRVLSGLVGLRVERPDGC